MAQQMQMQQPAPGQSPGRPGLVAGAVRQATGAPPSAPPAPMAAETASGTEEATPEEQEAFERTKLAAEKILYTEKTGDELMKMVSTANTPEDGIAEVASMVVLQVDEASGMRVPEQVILPVAQEVVADLVEMTNEAGIGEIDNATAQRIMSKVTTDLMEAYGTGEQEMTGFVNEIGEEQAKRMLTEMGQAGVFPE